MKQADELLDERDRTIAAMREALTDAQAVLTFLEKHGYGDALTMRIHSRGPTIGEDKASNAEMVGALDEAESALKFALMHLRIKRKIEPGNEKQWSLISDKVDAALIRARAALATAKPTQTEE